MRVLVACEFSGRVRDAFLAMGHDAISCDLLDTERPGPHFKGDVMDIINDGWDLMVAHPPCTYLSNSGVRWLYDQPDRWKGLIDGAVFFRTLLNADIPRVAVENPIMHKYAIQIIGRRQDQLIQPYMFGHPESKATCLWLRNLPHLRPTNMVKDVMESRPVNEAQRIFHESPGPDRWKVRSVTFKGIADAMANQWGSDE
jgi:hypothetical protein